MEQLEKKPSDAVFIALLILLAGSGLAAMFSSSFYYSERLTGDPQFFF